MIPTMITQDKETGTKYSLQSFTRDKYIPLPKTRGSIRLLKLFPGNFKTEQVDCELIPATLDENNGNVKFEALSWSWGTKQPTAYINIRQNEQTYAKYVSPDLVSAPPSSTKPSMCSASMG